MSGDKVNFFRYLPPPESSKDLCHLLLAICSLLLLLGCGVESSALEQTREPVLVTLHVDGQSYTMPTGARNVRELLAQAGVRLSPTDEVEPPLFTPIADTVAVRVARVTEQTEVNTRIIPFDRKIVRNEAMAAGEAPVIVQPGRTGVEEITIQVTYRDGVEVERRRTSVALVQEPLDEIVMVGLGPSPDTVHFQGKLAYISGGRGTILRAATAFPQALNTGANLDRRVFSLSPAGDYLLYTRATTGTATFNDLWLLSTAPDAKPLPLGVDNVLWAGWNPAHVETLQIAYTTGVKTDLPPGWEANNDLWLAIIDPGRRNPVDAEALIESYPATYGWWGGRYVWSPDGRALAYSFASEVGIIDLEANDEDERRRQLSAFTEYNTRADWVWLPSLSWSPDSRYLAFTSHAGADSDALRFETWVIDLETDFSSRFVEESGIWSHPFWSPAIPAGDGYHSVLAFLRPLNPLDSLRSSYALWLMDQDGSNGRQLYPPVGESGRFPPDQQLMAWDPTGSRIAFVYGGNLYLLDVGSGQAYQVTIDDTITSHPTWAPYGQAAIAARTQQNERPEPVLKEPTPEER